MKILEVELLTADLQSIEKFYSNKLQLNTVHKDEQSISYNAGHSRLTFRITETLQPVYHIAFEIPCNKLNEAIEWLSRSIALIPFENHNVIVDFENWNAKSVYFYDDNQNILEFILRFDNDIKSNDAFSTATILNISEVGLVNENVLQFGEALSERYDLPYYEKQPPRENFCALGSSEGLFVISGNERNWFPTDTKAVRYPVYVKFEEHGRLHELNYR
ncbi:glyoxalase [Taibaiella lutea]|uniref:Glyoxalase n=1 Tax=Taibaiella lutea TaxID=2608001 RepID=A0A5M6CIL8_9BACT|nr:glyoxalase [Taibaiella lutea]KAA5535048.1 glyoxalase [Taibaiella lutea]